MHPLPTAYGLQQQATQGGQIYARGEAHHSQGKPTHEAFAAVCSDSKRRHQLERWGVFLVPVGSMSAGYARRDD